jgi:hypothetical protein
VQFGAAGGAAAAALGLLAGPPGVRFNGQDGNGHLVPEKRQVEVFGVTG